jgi:hypothetical protein
MLGAAAANGGELGAARELRGQGESVVPGVSEAEAAERGLARYVRATEISCRWADQR